MDSSPELSIVVLHYNRWDLTKDCVASIDAQEIPCSYEKVLVDHGSTNSSLFYDPNYAPIGWRLVSYEDNRGHIVGQNRCFESAKGEWVLFVANDVRFTLDCIWKLWRARTEGQLGMIQPKLISPDGLVDNLGLAYLWPGYGLSNKDNIQVLLSLDACSSTCYLMKKHLWQEIEGFDESLESSYEDIDMGLRLQAKGLACYAHAGAEATHLGNATLRHMPSHNRAAFHRDRVYIVKKHYRGFDRALRLAAITLIDSTVHLGRQITGHSG